MSVSKKYSVNVGYDRLGRERNIRFKSMRAARTYCNMIAERYNVILSINRTRTARKRHKLKWFTYKGEGAP